MSKEELKKIDLKVSVNCCEGCKRKVLKALSIKGVLKIEIHPNLPKITVLGDVDVHTLIRKLAKTGKMAEQLPTDTKSEKPIKKAKEGEEKNTNNEIMIKKAKEGDKNGNIEVTDLTDANKYEYQTVVTTIPRVNPNIAPPDHTGVCYQMEPNYSIPPPCCNQHQHRYEMPVQYSQYLPPVQSQRQQQQQHYDMTVQYSQYPPPVQSQQHQHHYGMPFQYHQYPPQGQLQQQPEGFMDYFNDDNTVGCCVM